MSVTDIAREADANQRKASDPAASAWVSANAGAGKTTVLVARVLRLLLEGPSSKGEPGKGTPPERILCLTYTKTAAAEMENRLFGALADWTALDDEALGERLQKLTGRTPDAQTLKRARRLFARTLEAKGGLKIHTIHAFCERLLHRFPLEAGVPPDFQVLEDRERQALRDAALYAVLDRAARDPGGRLGDALNHVVAATGEERFRDCIAAVLAKPEELRRILEAAEDVDRFAEDEAHALRRLLGVRADASEESLHQELAAVLDDAALDAAASALDASDKKTDKDMATALKEARNAPRRQRIAALSQALLTQAGEPRARVCTQGVAAAHPAVAASLTQARDTFFALTQELLALRVAGASAALLTLAEAITGDYEARKAARAGLDYEDLILKTVSLLRRSEAAAWVLYKLDGGIDHILVDEAQDTSPAQWQVISALAEEFFSGEGARETLRTIFAVGDEKQSIYSFQGAAPAAFGRQGRAFRRLAEAIGHPLHAVPLNLSFRSTTAVLSAVDAVFARQQAMAGLTWEETAIVHHAYRQREAGLIEVWPIEEPPERSDTQAFAPLDDAGTGVEAVDRVVRGVADMIAGWLRDGTLLPSQGRPITPSDILILVAKRDPFVRPMIKALKDRNVPVAGADRMRLTEQLAVLDLLALGDFLLMPEDDLSLATLLKSPLFGLDDDDLFALAYGRDGSLWRSLRASPDHRQAAETLEAWLARADYQPPYEFYAGVLEEHGMAMRRHMLARLGPDAGDAIDEFLNLALAYDRVEAPSLQGFLDFVRRGEAEVKRDMEQGRDEVRIMTVHGAKGLEANIVILPDTCSPPTAAARAAVIPVTRRGAPPDAAPHLVWALPGASKLPAIAEAKGELADAQREEYNRLLYVAMTRARDRLYVGGWANRRSRNAAAGSWYEHVREGLRPLAHEQQDGDGRTVLRHEESQEEAVTPAALPELPLAPRLPDWARRPAPKEAPTRVPLAPSSMVPYAAPQASGEQDVASPLDLADRARFLRGEVVHGLLQHLPAIASERWEAVASAYLARRSDELAPEQRQEIVRETLAVLRHPDLAPLFGPESRAEVPIVARLRLAPDSPPVEISGQVDRLAVLDDAVLIVDYKTNRPPPERAEDVAPAYVAQLAAYRAALRQMFPDRPVRCALLWTAVPRIMELPEPLLDEAEVRLTGDQGLRS